MGADTMAWRTMTNSVNALLRLPESGLDVAALQAELRSQGFDLRRSAFVTYLLETGADRDAAYAIRRQVAADGWQVSLYGDRTGWVVRLGRSRLLRPQRLVDDHRYVHRLAQANGAAVRGFCVEEPHRDDLWETLAAQVQRSAAAVPSSTLRRLGTTRQSTRRRLSDSA